MTLIILDRKEKILYADYKSTTNNGDGVTHDYCNKIYNLNSGLTFAYAGHVAALDEFLYYMRDKFLTNVREFRELIRIFLKTHRYPSNYYLSLMGFMGDSSFSISSPDFAVISDIPYDEAQKINRFKAIGSPQTCVSGMLNYLSLNGVEPDITSIFDYASKIDSGVSKHYQTYRRQETDSPPKIKHYNSTENLAYL